MVCDQALERIHAVHEAGYVSIFVFIFVITAIGLTTCFVQLLTLAGEDNRHAVGATAAG